MPPCAAIMAGVLLAAGVAPGAEIIAAREEAVDLKSPFVPVCLDAYANDAQGLTFPSSRITVEGVPFDLVTAAGCDNLFLRQAGWPDWAEDPSSYYARFDSVPADRDPRRPFFQLPVADYACAWLLAATDPNPELSPVLTLRIGCFDGPRRTAVHDFAVTVPRFDEKRGEHVVRVIPVAGGNLFLLRVPLGLALAQDFRDRTALDLELTKQLHLAIRRPDPCRFNYRPLGLPSGVHVFGLTLQRCPVQMEVTSPQPGHVFNQPATPTFEVTLREVHSLPARGARVLEAIATDLHGASFTWSVPVTTPLVPAVRVTLPVPVPDRGWYALQVRFKRDEQILLTRHTHFALLAPDTRRHRDQAPWGAWDFCGAHYTPADPDLTGPLFVKAGLRYGMFNHPAQARARYGVLKGNDPKAKSGDDVRKLAQTYRDDPSLPAPERIMIFHEDAISGPHLMRVPALFTGLSLYHFDPAEQARFDQLWQGAISAARAIRHYFPRAEIYFGNGNVHLLEEFLARGFPRELIGARGNEAGSFQRLPEAQPPDFTANNAGLWMDRQVLDHYGYHDVSLRQCYEICYPSTNPGNLSLHTQAAYYVRHILHSMAWGIPIIRAGLIVDVGNSYWFSNWGASGFCFAQPDVRPKPAYVAVAVMTQVLDGARFQRIVPCTAPTVYALEFLRADGFRVTCLWTVRGQRQVRVQLSNSDGLRVVDMMGLQRRPELRRGEVHLTISGDPLYLIARGRVQRLAADAALLPGPPEADRFLISPLTDLGEWTIQEGPDAELQWYDFICPRRPGSFEYAKRPEFEGQPHVLGVRPRPPVAGSPYLPMYSSLRHREGVELPGQPTEIGLMVNGNGGWGRVIFELTDASGQRWISLGCERRGEPTRWLQDLVPAGELSALASGGNDWNTSDPWGRSYINFEGWGYVSFPLPGNYPGEGYHWPSGSQWRYDGDGVVHYPLRFTRLVLTLPERVLRFTEYEPVPRQEIYLKDLMVTYRPPEEAWGTP